MEKNSALPYAEVLMTFLQATKMKIITDATETVEGTGMKEGTEMTEETGMTEGTGMKEGIHSTDGSGSNKIKRY